MSEPLANEWPLPKSRQPLSRNATGFLGNVVSGLLEGVYLLIYAGVLAVLVLTAAGNTPGFGKWWTSLPIGQRLPWLK